MRSDKQMHKKGRSTMYANKSQTVICLMKNTTILKVDSFHQPPWCRRQQSDMANYYYYYSWSWGTLVCSSAASMRNCDGVHSTAIITHTLAKLDGRQRADRNASTFQWAADYCVFATALLEYGSYGLFIVQLTGTIAHSSCSLRCN